MKDFRRWIGRRLVINTTSNDSFEGTLRSASGDLLVLDDVTMHQPDKADLDGEIAIPTARLGWVQVV